MFEKIAAKLALNKGGDIIAKVMDGADKLFTSKEEKMQLQNELTEKVNAAIAAENAHTLEMLKAELGDNANARDSNVKIQESEKSSWMAKNFAYYMDAFFCIIFGAMLFVIIKKEVPEGNKELFYTAFGSLGAYVGSIVNFHRGTSQGSKDGAKTLHSIAQKK